jgi:hypothetical protein
LIDYAERIEKLAADAELHTLTADAQKIWRILSTETPVSKGFRDIYIIDKKNTDGDTVLKTWVDFKDDIMQWSGKQKELKLFKQAQKPPAQINQVDPRHQVNNLAVDNNRIGPYKAPVYTYCQRCASKQHLVASCPDRRDAHKCGAFERIGHCTEACRGVGNRGPPPAGGWPRKQQQQQPKPTSVNALESTGRPPKPGFPMDGEYNDPSCFKALHDNVTDARHHCSNTSSRACPHPHVNPSTNHVHDSNYPTSSAYVHVSHASVSVGREQQSTSKEVRDASRCLRNRTPRSSKDRIFRTTERKPRVQIYRTTRAAGGPEVTHEARQATSREPGGIDPQDPTDPAGNGEPKVAGDISHDEEGQIPPDPRAGDRDCVPDTNVMNLTIRSSAFISANYDDAHREHSIYVNTLDADGNPEDVEKMESPKIALVYQKHSYRSRLSER